MNFDEVSNRTYHTYIVISEKRTFFCTYGMFKLWIMFSNTTVTEVILFRGPRLSHIQAKAKSKAEA